MATDVVTASYPTPSKSAATKNLADRQNATWPSFLKDADNVDSMSERTASQYEDGTGQRADAEIANQR